MRWYLCLLLAWMMPLYAQDDALSHDDRAALAALADVLDNPAQRDTLISELRRISSAQAGQTPSAATDTVAKKAAPATGGYLSRFSGKKEKSQDDAKQEAKTEESHNEAEAIKAVTENAKAAVSTVAGLPKKLVKSGTALVLEVGGNIRESWQALVGVFTGHDAMLRNIDMEALQDRLLKLGVLMGLSILLYQGVRSLGHRIRRRLQRWVIEGKRYNPLLRRVASTLATSVFDVVSLLFSVLAAVIAVIYFFDGDIAEGVLGEQVILFVQAYIAIELLKTAIRALFYPHYPALRFLPVSNAVASYWYRALMMMINLLGYGYLVVLPLINANLSWSLGRVFSAVLAVVAFIYGVSAVMRKRNEVRESLLAQSAAAKSAIIALTLRVLARVWHWLALAYFIMLLVVTMLRADKALPFVMQGTINSVLVIGGGLLLSALLSQYIRQRLHFSPEWQRRLPGLDQRLNALVPTVLRILRFTLLPLMIFGVLSAWGMVNIREWLASAGGQAFLNKWSGVFLIIMITALFWLTFTSFIEYRLHLDQGKRSRARAQTLLSLFRSALTVILFSIAGMMVLSEIGINIGPLIAGAGVLGLAIGFGAQKLVQDIITGIFFQIENAMNKGDMVTVDGITGTAEHISIRSVGVRDSSGTYHLIPFSNVTRVSNYMRGYANHIAEYGIAYRESIDDAIAQLRAAFEELAKGELKHHILEPINVHGVTQLADSAVMIRISIKTTPGEQWIVGRAYNRLVKMYFDAAGIEIPYPHMQVYFGQNKDGSAPPLYLKMDKTAAEDMAPEEKTGARETAVETDGGGEEGEHKKDFTATGPAKVDTHGTARLPDS